MKSIVTKVDWLSSVIVEVSLQDHQEKYFVSPLQEVEEGRRSDEVQVGDVAVLAGRYIILAVPDDEEISGGLLLTNFMKITSVEEVFKSGRGANRDAGQGRGGNRQPSNGKSLCMFV